MARDRTASFQGHIQTLFTMGTASGLTDAQLLERFRTRRGEAAEPAFAALVARHGPMVLHACRNILRDEHDAQDAFQATFLILVRKAGSLWVRDSVGPWLHRVACRVAVRAKLGEGRRRAVEREAADAAGQTSDRGGRGEGWDGLHEEIDRLPERYRRPVVLCYLEGLTYEQAARQLGCPVGTIKSRLARGRESLRRGLGRDGDTAPPRSAVPAALAAEAVRRAVGSTPGVSARATILIEGGLKAMLLTKWKSAAMALAAAAAVTAGVTAMGQQGRRQGDQGEAGAPSTGADRPGEAAAKPVEQPSGFKPEVDVAELERRVNAMEHRLGGPTANLAEVPGLPNPVESLVIGPRKPGDPYADRRGRLEAERKKDYAWDVLVIGGFVGQYDLDDVSPRELVLGLYRMYYGVPPTPDELSSILGWIGEDRDKLMTPERIVRKLLNVPEFLSTPLVEAILRNERTRKTPGVQ